MAFCSGGRRSIQLSYGRPCKRGAESDKVVLGWGKSIERIGNREGVAFVDQAFGPEVHVFVEF